MSASVYHYMRQFYRGMPQVCCRLGGSMRHSILCSVWQWYCTQRWSYRLLSTVLWHSPLIQCTVWL